MGTPLLDGLLPFGITIVILSYIPEWVVVFSGVFALCYCYQRWRFGAYYSIGIPGPTPLPIIGTLLPVLIKGIRQTDFDLIQKYGRVVGTWEGPTPAIIISDPELLKEVFIKQFHCFSNRRSGGLDEYPIRKSLTRLTGTRWKEVRSLLNSGFTTSKLKKMFDPIIKCSESLVERLGPRADQGEPIDFKHACGSFAMEVITRTAFQIDPNSRPEGIQGFLQHAQNVFNFNWTKTIVSVLLLLPFSHRILRFLHVKLFPQSASDFFLNVIGDAIEKHIEDPQKPPSFLQFMLDVLETSHNSNIKGLTPEEIEAQSLLFFLAGYETTASTMTFLFYCLATNPECQRKLIKEMDQVLDKNKGISSELISNLPYLDMCINETLRLYPPVIRVNRVCSSDVKIGSIQIHKGSVVVIPIYALHHDPDYWFEPEIFRPERFGTESKSQRQSMTFLPFGAGPRHCIGSKLFLLEIKLAVVHTLRNYSIIPTLNTQIPLKLKSTGLLQPEKGVHLQMTRRR